MPRKKPEGPPASAFACTENEWLSLWIDFNRRRDDAILVNRKALEHVCADVDKVPQNLITDMNARAKKEVLVNRQALFEFLKQAGCHYATREIYHQERRAI